MPRERPPRPRPSGPGTVPAAEPGAAAGRAVDPAEVPLLSNDELARIFHEIGDMLEVKGELVFKTVAYHRAADAIGHSPVDVAAAYRAGDPPRIAGVGQAISDKIAELATTGRLGFHDRLAAEVPPGLVELLRVPGVGPKTVRILHDDAGHREPRRPPPGRRGRPDPDGQGPLREDRAVDRRGHRRPRGPRGADAPRDGRGARDVARGRAAATCPGSSRSPRPARSGVGARRSAISTSWPRRPIRRRSSLGSRPCRPSSRSSASGRHKAAVRIAGGPQVDLMTMPPGTAGTYLIHFTGSKDHNVHLRGLARDRGWSLSEKGFLRIDPARGRSRRPPGPEAAELRTFATEAEAYRFLDLDFIEPELREDRGEIEAAAGGTLPRAGPARGPPGRPPLPLGLVGRRPLDRADGRGGPGARPRLPGPDRPQPVAGDRPRPDSRAGRAPAGRDRRP